MPDYLPRAEGSLRDWVCNFAAVVNANPSTLALMPSDAAAIGDPIPVYRGVLRIGGRRRQDEPKGSARKQPVKRDYAFDKQPGQNG